MFLYPIAIIYAVLTTVYQAFIEANIIIKQTEDKWKQTTKENNSHLVEPNIQGLPMSHLNHPEIGGQLKIRYPEAR